MTEINNDSIRKKAFGIMKSIETMSDNEKQNMPSGSFGQNYNNLRKIFLQNNPDFEMLAPPEAEFFVPGIAPGISGKKVTDNSYSEIHTFYSEIYHLLDKPGDK